MKTKNKAKTTSPSSAKTSSSSAQPLHASKTLLLDIDMVGVTLGAEEVLKDISFCIHSGEFIGLIGPNGAGKTTLLKVLLGLIAPQRGNVKLGDSRVGYIPQRGIHAGSIVPISVQEVVHLGSPHLANQALQQVGMAGFDHRRFSELSGGQQQRVLIAKALATEPSLLILDEPTTGIDEQAQADFYQTLSAL